MQWSPVVSLDAPPLTSATSAAQRRFWSHVGCCVLLRGVSFWSAGPVWLLCSDNSGSRTSETVGGRFLQKILNYLFRSFQKKNSSFPQKLSPDNSQNF